MIEEDKIISVLKIHIDIISGEKDIDARREVEIPGRISFAQLSAALMEMEIIKKQLTERAEKMRTVHIESNKPSGT